MRRYRISWKQERAPYILAVSAVTIPRLPTWRSATPLTSGDGLKQAERNGRRCQVGGTGIRTLPISTMFGRIGMVFGEDGDLGIGSSLRRPLRLFF